VANRGLFAALARHGGYQAIHWLTELAGRDDARVIERLLTLLGGVPALAAAAAPAHRLASPLATAPLLKAGTLLHGSAYLGPSAWARRHAGHDRRFSLVGTFFGIAVAEQRERMLGSLLAPLYPWDAVICSSPTVQTAVRGMLENVGAYLGERTGAVRLPLPQLPVIPIGVDVDAMAAHGANREAGQAVRLQLGLTADAVAVLWVGRLSWYDKAFPQPMLLALELAAQATGAPLHFLVAGWFPDPERDRPWFEEAARCHAPSVTVHWLDGNDQDLLRSCWAAADLFLSLSDTILETFGQAPVEAMAAGLPVVLSDWNGYRSLLRDGEEGYLIPTLAAPGGGNGAWLALLQSFATVDHQGYGGSVAQHVAVHVGRAAEALAALIRSPALRHRIGQAAQRRARSCFNWPVVVEAHQDLFAELAARRQDPGDQQLPIQPGRRRLPALANDPFEDFAGYASAVLRDDHRLRCTSVPAFDPGQLPPQCRLDQLMPGLRGTAEESRLLLGRLQQAGPTDVAQLLAGFPPDRHPFLRMSLVWLAKLGRIDWLPSADADSP
jgi:glycosyltransferase involved in cell wall biosynthesis